jgi:hypothetical protein
MNRLFFAFIILGIFCLFSAISGIGSYQFGTHGTFITYTSFWERVVSAIFGCAFLFFAWGIRYRVTLAWRWVFPALWIGWGMFVLGATTAVTSQYPKASFVDVLIFAGVVALGSLPVAIYWIRRLHWEFKQTLSNNAEG